MDLFTTFLELFGLILIVVGVFLVSVPAGLIVAGVLTAGVGVLIAVDEGD